MSRTWNGEVVWLDRGNGRWSVVILVPETVRKLGGNALVRLSNWRVPLVSRLPRGQVRYRQRIGVHRTAGAWTAGPVYAILAGAGGGQFIGSRSCFRDLMSVARRRNCLMYVVPTNAVSEDATWTGYVRLGYRRWLALPVPHPEAMYNRIPTRYLERQPATVQAKQILRSLAIPMFNPDYFNKAEVYDVIRAAGLAQYLPETVNQLAATALEQMLVRHRAVYLKPAGGSIGHGMIRIDHAASGFTVSVLKNTSCKTFSAPTFRRLLQMIRQERVPGRYVIQAAVPLLMWKGRPCDFRVLLQKRGDLWSVVGKGVRVAGQHTITTHVPNGGSIADATEVMTKHFGEQSQAVDQRMDDMLIRCAKAIDAHYHYALGEMSMDVGVDDEGHPWFFEANAKPMKFDEADIRSRSLVGVLNHLDHLRQAQAPLTTGANRRG